MRADQSKQCGAAASTVAGEGRYANYLKVGSNATEFVLDFGQYYAGDGVPQFGTRIVTTPAHLQAFAALLAECLAHYVADHGPIAPLDGAGERG